MQTGPTPAPSLLGMMCFAIVLLGMLALYVWLFGTIARKAGYSFWMGLLMFVPVANLVVVILFAATKWPIEQELEHYRAQVGHYGGGQGFPVQQQQMPPR